MLRAPPTQVPRSTLGTTRFVAAPLLCVLCGLCGEWSLRYYEREPFTTESTITSDPGTAGTWFTAGPSGTWVTGVPEVRNICSQWRGTPAEIETRLRQLIDLPPDADTPRFLVFQVPATAVFRPAVNPAINTEYPCQVDDKGIPPVDCGNTFPANTALAHYQWMAQSAFGLQAVPDGYPWTHIGYTYNWRPGEDRYGTSEYVIQAGTKACVIEVIEPSWEYCLPDWKPATPSLRIRIPATRRRTTSCVSARAAPTRATRATGLSFEPTPPAASSPTVNSASAPFRQRVAALA